MKNHIPQSKQEERRKNSIKVIRKDIQKPQVMKIEKISRITYFQYKNLIRSGSSWQRKKGSGRGKRLTKPNKIKIHRLLRANPFQSCHELAQAIHPLLNNQTVY